MINTPVITRFAPSPTGYLHIGGARTALFNWLYARANGGKFLLRIEDTDRARSTPKATAALLKGLTWLGLDWDEDPISQFSRADRHCEVAFEMVANGHAYKCFSTHNEIEIYREQAKIDNNPLPFQSPWRDESPSNYPDAPFVIRLKSPREGGVVVKDKVQKKISWAASTFDDLILLRSDGTPTYMLAVVVDDHDMKVTHIIRGDDHLINAARQSLIYTAMGWNIPIFAHIPLIHGEDGKKLSKRHGATGIHEYAALGYMPAAMRNYLTRLGWSHGNDELFNTEQAIKWFGFEGMGRSPSRLDFKKLDHVSSFHIKESKNTTLIKDLLNYLQEIQFNLKQDQIHDLTRALPILKEKSKKLSDILAKAHFILTKRPLDFDDKSQNNLDSVSIGILNELTSSLPNDSWTAANIESHMKFFAQRQDLGLGKIGVPLKAALSGRAISPSAFGMMEILGRDESLNRINDAIKANQ